ncbi:MAG TPA: zinc ribbon domain-containing protein [Pyrinomonadaceae bacterium]
MYCPSCGNEITAELKYCNRCGANLMVPTVTAPTVIAPVRLAIPSIVLGLTIVGGLGVTFGAATAFAERNLPPVAIVWIVLFSCMTILGCVGLFIRLLTKMMSMQRELPSPPPQQQRPSFTNRQNEQQQLPPRRVEPVPSVTENTTRTFTPIYREPADRGSR